MDGEYEPIEIEELDEGRLRGYSEALGLHVCWEGGMLRFFDPVAGSYLRSHGEERGGRLAAESRAEEERADRIAAESRVAELEAEMSRLRGE